MDSPLPNARCSIGVVAFIAIVAPSSGATVANSPMSEVVRQVDIAQNESVSSGARRSDGDGAGYVAQAPLQPTRDRREEAGRAQRGVREQRDSVPPCLKELCIGGGIDGFKQYDWMSVASDELARIKHNARYAEEIFPANADPKVKALLSPYFYAGRLDKTAVSMLTSVQGVCRAVQLRGSYTSSAGNLTNVVIRMIPVDGGRAQAWKIVQIERFFKVPQAQEAELFASLKEAVPQLARSEDRAVYAVFFGSGPDGPARIDLRANKATVVESGKLFDFLGCKKSLRID
jgi:hypothetical protein